MTRGVHALLEPGALLSGALFRDFVGTGPVEALAAGTRLGAFRVVRELGRGGMGIVHLGERDDGEFTQQVALKCLVDRDSAAGSELFRRERQILASLRHPNIARLLDGGRADDGRLWFAMEWVEGERIDLHCARRALGVEDRLRLWLGVAEAVQFAHARLLIHRDIKPGNVLVDADEQPRLLDFGIAALLGDGEGLRAFSPGHASPEQRAGREVGTASDQYQLARLLERMLGAQERDDAALTTSLALPNSDAVVAEPQASPRSGMEDAAVLAASIDTRLRTGPRMSAMRRGELVSVLARGCAFDPAQRYGSVAELKADVQRVLDRRPVEARRRSWVYALLCAVRRRPFTALVAVLVSLAVMALVIGFNTRVARERDLALAETAKAKAINAFVSEDLLASANPFEVSRSDLTVREALDRARSSIGARFVDQPLLESELRQTLGMTYAGVGELGAAKDEFERALVLRERLDTAGSEASVTIRLLLARRALSASEYAEAEQILDELIAGLERSRPPTDRQLLAARILKVQVLGFLGHLEQAQALDAGLAVSLGFLTPTDDLVLERSDASAHLKLLAGHAEEALALFDVSARRCELAFGASHACTLRSLEGKARALRDLGRPADAVPVLQGLYARRLEIFGAEHPEALRNHNELAVALSQSGDRPAAISIWTTDLAIKQRRLGETHASTLSTRYNLGNELIASERYAEAETTFRQLLIAEKQARGEQDPGALITQMSLANAISRQSRPAEALVLLDHALEAGHETLATRPELGILLIYRSRALSALGRISESRAAARTAIEVFTRTVGSEHRRTRQAREWLASIGNQA